MLMPELFTFADPEQWSDARLQRRSAELERSQVVPQSDLRAFMIARELLHIVFEASSRQYAGAVEIDRGTA
jgi:hypothetical protein